jgi:hypothetical protein
MNEHIANALDCRKKYVELPGRVILDGSGYAFETILAYSA